MPFYYTPWIILPLLSAAVNGGLALHAWRRRHVPAAGWFLLLAVGMAGWSLSYALNTAATNLELKNFFFKTGTTFVCLSLFSTLPMTLTVVHPRTLRRRHLLLFALVPVVSALIAWSNDLHGWMRHQFHLVEKNGMLLFGYVDGPYFKPHILYVYLYYAVVIGICLYAMTGKKQVRRSSLALIVVATVIPLLTDILNLTPTREFHLATSTLFLSGLCYWLAVFRHHLLDLVPISRAVLFEQVQEPVLILDLQGRLADSNRAARELLQLRADAAGLPLAELFPEGSALHGLEKSGHGETVYDGDSGRWWHVSRTPAQRNGIDLGWLLLLRDVTAVHQVQERLRRSEERFRRLAENSADVVWETDADLRVTYVNSADEALRGFAVGEVVGTPIFGMLTGEDVPTARRANEERRAKEGQGVRTGPARYEVRMRHKDGGLLWAEVHSNPLRNAAGEITGYIGITRDMRVRKAEEERLAAALTREMEARSELDHFLEMISHEYLTPLAIIQANIDLLELKGWTQEEITAPVRKMRRAVGRLVDIFAAARRRKGLDRGLLEMKPVPQEVSDFLGLTVRAARDFWGERFLCLVEVPPGCTFAIDAQMMKTALLNLLDNAVKYSPPEAPITLRIGADAESLVLRIQNTAARPLAADTRPFFRKFVRGANSIGTSGTGLGLYLVDTIVARHGGRLELTVEKELEVTATVVLPLAFGGESALSLPAVQP